MPEMNTTGQGRTLVVIITGFLLVIVTMIGLAFSSVHFLSNAKVIFSRVVDQHNVQAELMHEVLGLAQERSLTLQQMLHTDDPFEQDEHLMHMGAIVRQYIGVREKLLALSLTEKEKLLLQQQGEQTNQTGLLQNRVVSMIMDESMAEAKRLLYEEAIPSQRKAMVLMREFISLQAHHNNEEILRVAESVDRDRQMVAAGTLLGLLTSLVIAIYVYRQISLELQRRLAIENELEERVAKRTEELNYLASHDNLTSLPNRGVFEQQLKQAIHTAKRYQRCYALLFIDLDGFKEVNDTYGHAAGDRTLVETARRLKESTRGTDTVARMGGDEFTILLSEICAKGDIGEICEKLLKSLNHPVTYQGQRYRVGASIGITCFNDDSRSADELLTEADNAMYAAKTEGKNTYRHSGAVSCCGATGEAGVPA